MTVRNESRTCRRVVVVLLIVCVLAAGALAGCTGTTAEPAQNTGTSLGATGDTVERETCFASQRTIDSAAAAYSAMKGTSPASVADLVKDGQLKVAPTCPATQKGYTLSGGSVAACPVHGHY